VKLFVCSDIHSSFFELEYSLKKSGYDSKNPNHKLIILGDLFDNGYHAKEVKDFVLKNKPLLIRGNHDDSLMRIYETGYIKKHDYTDGTFFTMQQLGNCFSADTTKVLESFREKNKDLMSLYYNTPYYLVLDDILFVHAWAPKAEDIAEATRDEWHKATLTNIQREIDLIKKGVLPNLYPYTLIKKIIFGHHKADALNGLENYKGEGVHTEMIKTLKTNDFTLYGIDGRVQLTRKIPMLILEVKNDAGTKLR